MKNIINELNKIEKDHKVFFLKSGRSITDYITEGVFNSGVFINHDLPTKVISKIREAFDKASPSNESEPKKQRKAYCENK
jgi:ABC-type Zn uptake system ZnuABC Zn-binding protein ZnuA